MANKIIFGADLIDVLENKYNMNKLGEVPTKYKNGVTTIDFIYGKEKNIDDLKYDKPYVEFSIDDETDGFISGTMYPNGGVEGIQFDSWEDLKYFMKNAKWIESRKSLKESNQITANIWEWQKLLNGVCNFTKWITRTFVKGETLHKALEKIYRNEEINLDEFVNACIDYIGDYQFEEKINEYVKQYLSTDDKIKNAFKISGIKVVESKKFVRKSLKEGIDIKVIYADDTPSEYIDDVTHNDILDIIDSSSEIYKIIDVSGNKNKTVWTDEYGFERAYESKKIKKSFIEKNTVNYWNKLHNIIPLDVRNESYRFATMCVTNLYNEDEYDSDDALIYFIDCYLSDKYPSWEDEVDMNEVATMLYNGKLKWKDIDKSWFE